jgi:hypothetical protein
MAFSEIEMERGVYDPKMRQENVKDEIATFEPK